MNLNLTIPLGGNPRIMIGGRNLISVTAVAGVPVRKVHSLHSASEK
jgi:hypothetical protein